MLLDRCRKLYADPAKIHDIHHEGKNFKVRWAAHQAEISTAGRYTFAGRLRRSPSPAKKLALLNQNGALGYGPVIRDKRAVT